MSAARVGAGCDQVRPETMTAGRPSAPWPMSSEAAAAISSAKAGYRDAEFAPEQVRLAAQVEQGR